MKELTRNPYIRKIDEKLPQCGIYFYCPFSKKETYWNGKDFAQDRILQLLQYDIAVYQNLEEAELDLPKAAASVLGKSKEFVFSNRELESKPGMEELERTIIGS